MTMVATLFCGLTLAVLAARLWWPFDLLTHFRLQYLVTSLALMVIALTLGARPAAGILAVVALVHAWAVKDLWLAAPAPPMALRDSVPLSIISANVMVNNQRPEAVAAFLRDHQPDIAVVVEAQGEKWTAPLSRLADLYPYAAPDGWRDGGEPVVILSRHPIRYEALPPRMADRPPYLLTTITVGGRDVTVVGVHPTSPDAFNGAESRARNRQLDLLAEHLQAVEGPAIVAGDFNTSLWSPHARDLMRDAGLHAAAAGFGWHATWPAGSSLFRVPIDHVLLRGLVATTDFHRGPQIGSDHLPVMADLRLAKGEG